MGCNNVVVSRVRNHRTQKGTRLKKKILITITKHANMRHATEIRKVMLTMQFQFLSRTTQNVQGASRAMCD